MIIKQTAIPAPEDFNSSIRPDHASQTSIRPAAYILGLGLVVGVSVLSVYADMSAIVVQFGVLQISPPAVSILFVIGLVNMAWKRRKGHALFRPAEMLVIYAMLLVAVMVSTRGLVEKVVGSIAYLPYAISHTNREFLPFLSRIPAWVTPYDPRHAIPPPDNVVAFYEGSRNGVPWKSWLEPLSADFALFVGVILTFLSLGTILRRQWSDVEQLSFPLTTLPIAIIQNESGGQQLFQSPLFWSGAAISAIIFGMNGLAMTYPSMPHIPLSYDLSGLLASPPWNAVGYGRAYLSLAVVGFAYFIPGDVLLSMWLFFILYNAQGVVASTMGYPSNISSGWPSFEVAGAYVVIAFATFWQSRPHLRLVWKTAIGSKDGLDDRDEMMSYRAALVGLVVGISITIIWMAATGMSVAVASIQTLVYVFVVALVMSRAVAQAGLLMTETSFLPQSLINMIIPLKTLGPTNLAMLSVTNTFVAQDLRGELLSPVMDTQRIATGVGAKPKSLLWPFVWTVLISFIVASATYLKLSYSVGGNQLYGHPHEVPNYEMAILTGPINGIATNPVGTGLGAFAVGAILCIVLTVMRARFAWFPLHPLGLALCSAWSMKVLWFGFLVAWIVRGVVVKYGGLSTFRKFSPLMLGLIVGEFTSAVFWSVLHMAYGVTTPLFPWP